MWIDVSLAISRWIEGGQLNERPLSFFKVGLFFVLGAAFVILGWLIPGLSDYGRSILGGIGVAVGLVGPLYIAEHSLSRRVRQATDAARDAEQSVASLRSSINELLDQGLHDRLEDSRAEDKRREQKVAAGDRAALVDAYAEAADHRWIDSGGIRVATRAPELWVRVRVDSSDETIPVVVMQCEDGDLNPIGQPVQWTQSEQFDAAMNRLIESLQDAVRAPSDDDFKAGEARSSGVANTLWIAKDVHTGSRGEAALRRLLRWWERPG